MVKIAYLLMCHTDPGRIIDQAEALTAHGDVVAIHFDKNGAAADFETLRAALSGNPNVVFARRVRCGWGAWSLVQASLNLITVARKRFADVERYVLLSGDCYPTKSRGYIDRIFAANQDRDIIEVNDFFTSGWIKTGLKEDRLVYRHWFNERSQPKWFYKSLEFQRKHGLSRKTPEGLSIRIGSQWWALRAATIDRLMTFLKARRDVVRFFRTTWIPDEIFFQTLVAHLVPAHEILSEPPTLLAFTDYGMPVVFHQDHYDYLRAHDRFLARKLSTGARGMRSKLLNIYREWESDEPEGGAGEFLYPYLARRGRTGERYARRFWQTAIEPREEAEILIIAAKIWHVGKAVERAIAETTGLTPLGYLFDEDVAPPIDLGNLERGLVKRSRHRRALINLILDSQDEQRLLFCIDPSRLDVVDDLAQAYGSLRLLAVERVIPDEHIHGHMRRVGLVGEGSGSFERREAAIAVRHEFDTEVATIRRAHRNILYRNDLSRPREENIVDMGHFLRLPRAQAEPLVREAERYAG